MSKKKKKKKQKDDDFIVGEDDFLPAEYFEGDENPFWEPPDDDEPEPEPDPNPEPKPNYNKIRDVLYHSPKTVFDLLDKRIYGNDEYKRTLSTLVWKAYNWQPPGGALLVVGQSGTGKTEAIRALRSYGNILIINGASITPTGYKGPSLTSNLSSLHFLREEDSKGRRFGRPVVAIDEFDKLVSKSHGSWSDSAFIFELLQLIEGSFVDIGENNNCHMTINTGDIQFILLGSFSALTDTQKSHPIGFGSIYEEKPKYLTQEAVMATIPPELRGRISETVMLDPLTEQDYRNIMFSKQYSPVKHIGEKMGIDILISEETAEQIAMEAFSSKTGVRSMNSAVERYVNKVLFDKPNIKHIYME